MGINVDKNKIFYNQLTQGDPDECIALATIDIAGNILGKVFNPDFTYAATLFLEGIMPNTGGSDPWTGLQSAIGYGLLPQEDATFTAQTMSELYAANWSNYTLDQRKLALPYQMKALKNIGVDFNAVIAHIQSTGQGVMMPMTWFSSFLDAPGGVLGTPVGSLSNHVVAIYGVTDDNRLIFKPWLGNTWGDGGYGYMTQATFSLVAKDCFAFDQEGSHWLAILGILFKKFPYSIDKLSAQTFTMPITSVISTNPPTNPDVLLPDWSLPVAAHHNVRVLCDLEGLTYEQKEILTACVYIESEFNINAEHVNRDVQGNVLSTDYSLVQVNDYWNIGVGKPFPSVSYVFAHPEEQVRWMCQSYKQNGDLRLWYSYTSGAYKRVLGKV